MKKSSLIIVLVCLFIGGAFGQEITEPFKQVVPPSPTVANLMTFEEVPVNLYTGSPNISFPLFQRSIGSGLGMNVQLSYNTSGIRVDQRSGWTGTGWSLMAGGSISRTVKDVPDEANGQSTSLTSQQYGTLNNGYHNYDGFTQAQKEEFLWASNAGIHQYDSQVDVFQFNFMGKTGRFSIVRNISGDLEVKLISRNEKIKVVPVANSEGVIDSFTLTDAKGYRYVFDVYEVTTNSPFTDTKTNYSTESTPSAGLVSDLRSAWHLTKVLLPIASGQTGVELVSLTYMDVTESYSTPVNKKTNTALPIPVYGDTPDGNYNKSQILPYSVTSYSGVTVATKKLSSINFRDGSQIIFEKELDSQSGTVSHPEYGLLSGVQLGRVTLSEPGGDEISYDFEYTTSTNDRLFLTKIDHIGEKGGSNDPKTQSYLLSYNNLNELPEAGNSAQDQWGFYNYLNNNGNFHSPEFSSYSDANKVTTGVLTSISYPTGGTKRFFYEPNRFSWVGNQPVNPLEVPENLSPLSFMKNFTATAGSTANEVIMAFYASVDHPARLTQGSLTVGADVNVANHHIQVDAVTLNQGFSYNQSIGTSISDTDRVNHFTSDPNRSNISLDLSTASGGAAHVVQLSTGWYLLRIRSDAYLTMNGDNDLSADLTMNYRKYQLVNDFFHGAGIRIKEIQFAEGLDARSTIRYSYDEPFDAASPPANIKSSGSFDGMVLKDRTYLITRKHIIFANGYNETSVQYRVDEDKNAIYSTADRSHYVGYRHVKKEQVDANGVNNGSTTYVITSPREHPPFPTNYGYPFLPVEDLSYKKGLTEVEIVYDASGDQILKKENEYAFSSVQVVKSIDMYQGQFGNCPWDRFYDNYTNYLAKDHDKGQFGAEIPNADNCTAASTTMQGEVRWEVGTRADLIETIQTEYFPAQPGLSKETKQTFTYDSVNWQISSKHSFIKEGGDEYKYSNYFYYPHSYPSEYYDNPEEPTQESILASMVSANMYNELIATSSTKQEVGVPLSNQTLGIVVNKYFGSTSNYRVSKYRVAETPATASSLEDRVEVVSYDGYNNPLEVKPTDGPSISYAWGYGSTVPVIQAQNVSQADLQTAIQWAIANTSGLPPGTTTLQEVLDYVGDMSQPYQRTRWGDFNAKLKEHPLLKYSQLTSMTYHPVYGMISQTAPDGMVMYYEYDSFGRLKYVKDQDGNILKMNEYAYQQTASTTGN